LPPTPLDKGLYVITQHGGHLELSNQSSFEPKVMNVPLLALKALLTE
jgi:hypothetical protein